MADSFKVRVWAVLGGGKTGKSTVIGNLTSRLGKGRGAVLSLVALRGGGYLQICARRQSLQEAGRSPEDVVRDAQRVARGLQKKEALSNCYLNLLIAIRIDATRSLPPASDYLSHFIKSGWSLESLVILDFDAKKHSRYFTFGAPTYELYGASNMAQNNSKHQQLVGQVRNHFGWA